MTERIKTYLSSEFLNFYNNIDDFILFCKIIPEHYVIFNEFLSEYNLINNLDDVKLLIPIPYYNMLSKFEDNNKKIHFYKLLKKLVNLKFSEEFKVLMENQNFYNLITELSTKNKFWVLNNDSNNFYYSDINQKNVNSFFDYFEKYKNENKIGIEMIMEIIKNIIKIKLFN